MTTPRRYLDDIVAWHRTRAAGDERQWRERIGAANETGLSSRSFRQALIRDEHAPVRVIAEIKRRSPSKGWLAPDLNPSDVATLYESSGAAAISVLTDHEFFAGSPEDLRVVNSAVDVPILRKDFTVSENDILDATEWGASAVLLIVSILSDDELVRFIELSRLVGLDALVEVHDITEAHRARAAGADLIGVNQRNLQTFDVDSRHAESVVAAIQAPGIATVCESSIRNVQDVRRAGEAGFDAVLVGEAFVTANDVAATVHSFSHVRPNS